MRVVFTGTSGADKKHAINRLADYIRDKHGKTVSVIEAEVDLHSLTRAEYYEFLDAIPGDEAARQWSASIANGIRAWDKDRRVNREPDFSFLSLHLVYHVHSHFYSPLNWSYTDDKHEFVSLDLLSVLRSFQPHMFVNLFDNVYSLQKRIKEYPFRLIELLRWRNLEMLTTDLLARLVIDDRDRCREKTKKPSQFRYERSPIVAVRHPRDMLYRLIADQKAHRIYMAYPISEPREVKRDTGDETLLNQVNAFRDHMRSRFVAFDPVTIDERPLKFLWEGMAKDIKATIPTLTREQLVDELNASISGRRTLTLREGDLWPTSPEEYDEMLCGPQVHYRNGHGSPNGPNGELPQPWELQLSAAEVQLAIEEKKLWAGSDKGGEIDNQIAQRDYRLIDQVDCVVIYRPSMRKRGWDLGGTRLEYMHAVETGKPVLVIRDKIDGPLEKPPFNTGVNPFNILEWQHLDTNKDEQMNCFVEAEKRIKTNISKTFSGL